MQFLTEYRHHLILTSIALVIVGLLTAYLVAIGEFGPTPAPSEATSETHPTPWSVEGERAVALRFDKTRGPLWLPDGASDAIALTPQFEGLESVEWEVEQVADRHHFIGRGTLHGHPVRFQWTFATNNPQAHFRFIVREPSADLLDRPLTGDLQLPAGTLTALDSTYATVELNDDATDAPRQAIGPWTPTWARWQGTAGEASTLTFTGWTGDAVIFDPRGPRPSIEWTAWSPEHHPLVERCGQSVAAPENLELDLTLTFGAAPTIIPSRFSAGHTAALAPIFDLPDAHPDKTLHQASAQSPSDWLRRARTLAFGHSNSQDPRYGNGGLLGHGLGGIITIPAAYLNDENVRDFLGELEDTSVAVFSRGLPPRDISTIDGVILERVDCDALATHGENYDVFLADTGGPQRGTQNLLSAETPPATPSSPTLLYPDRLDGRRSSLIGTVLTRPFTDQLLNTRGLALFSSPLIGTRNPLVPAAHEALLKPERNGHWTLTEPFAAALADLELWTETTPLLISSINSLVRHSRTSHRTRLWWQADNSLVVENASESPISRYTLTLPTSINPSLSTPDAELRRRQVEDAPHFWVWWNLPTGSHRLEFTEDSNVSHSFPQPVTWAIQK